MGVVEDQKSAFGQPPEQHSEEAARESFEVTEVFGRKQRQSRASARPPLRQPGQVQEKRGWVGIVGIYVIPGGVPRSRPKISGNQRCLACTGRAVHEGKRMAELFVEAQEKPRSRNRLRNARLAQLCDITIRHLNSPSGTV
jgi:hypothetical protein